MKAFRIGLHSFALCVINLAGIVIGSLVSQYFLGLCNRIAGQVLVAAVLSIVGFIIWLFLVQSLPVKKLHVQNSRELIWVYFFGLAWCPVIFVPLHYLTQGYLTSFGNILGTWIFQLPVNFFAILVAEKTI